MFGLILGDWKIRLEIGKSLSIFHSFIANHVDVFLVLILITISSIILFPNLGSASMWGGDEKIHFQWANHIVSSGDYITPWANDNIYLWVGKPPLVIWLMSFSLRVFETNFAIRFWGAFFGVLSSVFVFYTGKFLVNRIVGFISAIILLTFSSFYGIARSGLLDVPLTFFLLGSIYFFLKSEDSKKERQYVILSGVFFGLALMTKQLSALLIPIIIFFYLLFTRRSLRFLLRKPFVMFAGIGSLIFSPWVILMTLRFGIEFLRINFYYSVFQRATTVLESKVGDYFFYFNYLISSENKFWLVLLPFAIALLLMYVFYKKKKAHILLLVWILVVLGIFSISQTKISHYIIPVFPAFALILGNLLHDLFMRLRAWGLIPIAILIMILLVAPLTPAQAQLVLSAEKDREYLYDSKVTSLALLSNGNKFSNIVTGGYFTNGSAKVADINIWKFKEPTFEILASNHLETNTTINCVVVGDVDADNQSEIVSVGNRDNGLQKVAQLSIWNSDTLELENKTEWHYGYETTANAVAIGTLDKKEQIEIVTAGTFYNGTCTFALLCLWNAQNLSIEKIAYWVTFGNTTINSIAISDVDEDGSVEIITGGYCLHEDKEISQVSVWDSTLNNKMITGDFYGWTSLWNVNVRIVSLAIGDVDSDGSLEIVTGGYCYQNESKLAQITIWNGKDLSPKKSNGWEWFNCTSVTSLTINYSDEDGSAEIITAGNYFNGTSNGAQIFVWSGSSLSLKAQTPWGLYYGSQVNAVTAINDVYTGRTQILTGGSYNNGTKEMAQLLAFDIQP